MSWREGIAGSFFFEKEEIKILMIRTLGEATIRSGWKIHAYAIMDNRYHLLLEMPQESGGGNEPASNRFHREMQLPEWGNADMFFPGVAR